MFRLKRKMSSYRLRLWVVNGCPVHNYYFILAVSCLWNWAINVYLLNLGIGKWEMTLWSWFYSIICTGRNEFGWKGYDFIGACMILLSCSSHTSDIKGCPWVIIAHIKVGNVGIDHALGLFCRQWSDGVTGFNLIIIYFPIPFFERLGMAFSTRIWC